jgi:tryptophanyl-tRNA synthetase
MKKDTILSGMRPTGRLHLGHLSVLENWRRFQERYNCYYMVANWHALTTAFDDPGLTVEATKEMVLDWLMVGIDPEQSTLFVQSEVKEHRGNIAKNHRCSNTNSCSLYPSGKSTQEAFLLDSADGSLGESVPKP